MVMLWHLQVGDSRGGGGGGGGGGGNTNFTSYGDWSEQMSSSGKKYYYNRYRHITKEAYSILVKLKSISFVEEHIRTSGRSRRSGRMLKERGKVKW